MLRLPLFLVVLSVAMMAAGGIPSPFGFITSGFRSLAEYKLATTAKLASYLAGDRAVKATIDLKVADDPDAGAEQAATEGPAVDVPIAVLQQAPQVKPQELSSAPASDEEAHDFKKHFAAGYAALDFANQLEQKRLATAASTKTKNYDAPVLSLPLEHYKDYVTAGETGGSLMRVAVVAQDVPKPFYSSQPNHDSAQTWNQQGASPALPEQQVEQQQQQPPTEGSSAGPTPTFSGYPQGHIFPYSGWPSAQPSGYPAMFQQSSYDVPADAPPQPSNGDAAHHAGESSSPAPEHHDDVVIPGSQFPQLSEATPGAESAPDTAEATPSTLSLESDVSAEQQGPRYRRDVVYAEEVSFQVPGTNLTIHGQDIEAYFRYVKTHDTTECLAKIFCTMAAQPTVFGSKGVDMTEFFRSYQPQPNHTSVAFYKEASAAGAANADCDTLFSRCPMSADQMKAAFNHDMPPQ
ncbi:uncharacterized protein LOC125946631 [Dermacentor silvarum]|uniref:uncharacterized protein LOC125946631 n=1 Tax=Dermacentor silvarum TaxID=543639 RepID=UPI002100E3F3|nr:uncharacterized protein LOC125946631 [Dermacentor silvarum]